MRTACAIWKKEMDVDVLIFGHFHHPIIEESEVLLLSSGSVIVLDEPTTGQDRGHLNKFLARMKMLNEAGKTIILISHDMGVVAEYASRIIVMKDGGILMDASTREVSTSNQRVISKLLDRIYRIDRIRGNINIL